MDTKLSRAVITVKNCAQIFQASRHSTHGKNQISSLVTCLFFYCSPIAIGRFIASVIVASFKSQAGQRLTHVFEKVLKRFPSLANLNAPASIVVVLWLAWVGTTLSHVSPSRISSGFLFATGEQSVTVWFSSSGCTEAALYASQPPTGNQVTFVLGGDGPTFTLAQEVVWSGRIAQNEKLAKPFTDQFNLFCHTVVTSLFESGGVRLIPALTAPKDLRFPLHPQTKCTMLPRAAQPVGAFCHEDHLPV